MGVTYKILVGWLAWDIWILRSIIPRMMLHDIHIWWKIFLHRHLNHDWHICVKIGFCLTWIWKRGRDLMLFLWLQAQKLIFKPGRPGRISSYCRFFVFLFLPSQLILIITIADVVVFNLFIVTNAVIIFIMIAIIVITKTIIIINNGMPSCGCEWFGDNWR